MQLTIKFTNFAMSNKKDNKTMDKRFVYVTVKMEITNPNKEVITDEDIENVINDVDYKFNDVDDFHINTEIVDYECN